MRAATGTVLGRRYRLTEPIASGGMGEVWQADDELLGRTVAVKVLRDELVSEPGFLARFRTEARNSARLAHANIATTYDYGESDGSAWLVMELVPGEPLSDLLAREGALPPRSAMRILAGAGAGLAAAHAAGIVHRDVKPGNLLITPTGQVKVTDFGIARAAAEAPLTATGQVMGTAAYLAPEQATGRRDLTPAVDVYALGVLAHEMLAGERPFTGESQVAIALAQVNDAPPPLPRSVPGAARELVALCLAKDPLDRPAQAGVVSDVAGRIADGDDAGAMDVLEGVYAARHGGADAPGGAGDRTVVDLPPTSLYPGAADAGTQRVPWPEPAAGAGFGAAAAGAGLGAAAAAGRTGRTQSYDDQYDDQYDDRYDGPHDGRYAAAGAASGVDRYDSPTAPRTGQRTGQGAGVPPAAEPSRRRLTVPLLGLVAVLLVVLIVVVFKALTGHGASHDSPASTSSSTPTATVTTAPTPTQSSASDSPTETETSTDSSSASSSASSSPSAPASSASPTPSSTPSTASSPTASPTPSTTTTPSPSPSATTTSAAAAPAVATTVP